jgi:hypothetical protein
MSRYRAIFDRHGMVAEFQDDELVWARPGAFDDQPAPGPQVVRDIAPYRSMIDGSVIDGRKRHRDHLRAHRCTEIGNDTSHMQRKPIPLPSRKKILHEILADKGDRDVQKMIKEDIRNLR